MSLIILNFSDIAGGSYQDSVDKIEDSGTHYDYILKFNPDDGTWSQTGQLKSARGAHGASVVDAIDIIDYCN